RQAFEAGIAIGSERALDLKLLTTVDSRIAASIKALGEIGTSGRDLLLVMVASDDLERARQMIGEAGGRVDLALDGPAMAETGLPA
ncbi:FAD-binding oxidoreductase, partial [Rhizobiaceae sp. 2RAB30]